MAAIPEHVVIDENIVQDDVAYYEHALHRSLAYLLRKDTINDNDVARNLATIRTCLLTPKAGVQVNPWLVAWTQEVYDVWAQQLTGRQQDIVAREIRQSLLLSEELTGNDNRVEILTLLDRANAATYYSAGRPTLEESPEGSQYRTPVGVVLPPGKGDEDFAYYAHLAVCVTYISNLREWLEHHSGDFDPNDFEPAPEPLRYFRVRFFSDGHQPYQHVTILNLLKASQNSRRDRAAMLEMATRFWGDLLRFRAGEPLPCPLHLPLDWTLTEADALDMRMTSMDVAIWFDGLLRLLHAEQVLIPRPSYLTLRRDLLFNGGNVDVSGYQQSLRSCDEMCETRIEPIYVSSPPSDAVDPHTTPFYKYRRWAVAFLRSVDAQIDCTCPSPSPAGSPPPLPPQEQQANARLNALAEAAAMVRPQSPEAQRRQPAPQIMQINNYGSINVLSGAAAPAVMHGAGGGASASPGAARVKIEPVDD